MPSPSYFANKICEAVTTTADETGLVTIPLKTFGCALGQIGVPDNIESTEIRINMSLDGTNWYPLTDPTTNVDYVILNTGSAASYPIPLDLTKGWPWCQLVFNNAEDVDTNFILIPYFAG